MMVTGLIGDSGSGVVELLRATGGRFIGPADELDFSPTSGLAVAYALDLHDAATRLLAESAFEVLRREGTRIMVASQHMEFLRRVSDEVWWVHEGSVLQKGDPGEVLSSYSRHTAARVRQQALESGRPVPATLRRGDGRAELVAVQTLPVWTSGEEAHIRITVRFHSPVEDPVIGMMIRTRIGMEVFGTNTELEKLKIGPCHAGAVRTVQFRFVCNLCPQQYTITAASHDPDGVWHDWMEDAVAFAVTDTRYTAGVANLRATAELTDSPG